jgi:DNA-binding MarR family transcriptional regulator
MSEFAPDLLHRLVWELDRAADRMLRAHLDVPFSRAVFLFTLQRRGTLTQHELALALGYSDPAVSTMLKELGADGFVRTEASPDHARKRLVTITPKGRTIVRKGRALLAAEFGSLMSAAKVNQREYVRLTTRILDALSSKKEDAGEGKRTRIGAVAQ